MARFLDLDVLMKAVRPPVKRRFLLRDDATLIDLYAAVRDAFGWSGQRAFEAYPSEPGASPLATATDGPETTRVALDTLLGPVHRSLVVIYDPDAWWEHVVTLKRVRDLPDESSRRLVGGRGVAPREDVGGLAGYEAWRAAGGVGPDLDLDDLRNSFDA